MSLTIQLNKFEGPLALLLYLIRKEEMDIFDIKINEITHQYLEHIKLMKELDLEFASEFISMAATLIHIKSRMLLPTYNENGEIVETEDPRKELVQKLIEYQKYQEAGKNLYERPLLGRDTWTRGERERIEAPDEELLLEDNALFSLISSYRKVLKTIHKRVHQVAHKAQSIASRILEIKDRFVMGQRIALSELITAVTEKKNQVLITFLSVLELGKMGFVSIYQSENYGEIYLEPKKAIENDVINSVEEYSSLNADQAAENMMARSLDDEPEEEIEVEGSVVENLEFSFENGLDFVGDDEDSATDQDILDAELELANKNNDIENA